MKFSTLPRVYITYRIEKNQSLTLGDDLFHYCKSVLRMKLSEEFRIFNETDGEFKVKITAINKRDLKIIVGNQLRIPEPLLPLILAVCIIKPDRFIEAIKGAMQLGVTEIMPIISERTQAKSINYERINKCIIEATEQSERLIPAILHKPISLSGFCDLENIEQIIFANEEENKVKINNIKKFANNIAVLVGPEGGFSKEEKAKLIENKKVISISLGNTVLRSEIAAVAMVACVDMMRG
jgi:16S rRNA (uracil1498-N3)-methyltransferase